VFGGLVTSALLTLLLLPIVDRGSAAADEGPTFRAWFKRGGAA
jgi:hypothetical protein